MSHKIVDARIIGVVGKPHGVKGKVSVMLMTDYPDSIVKGSVLFLDENCTEEMLVKNIFLKRVRSRVVAVIEFKGIESRDDAGSLKGKTLYRKTKDSPELDENQYWIDDLEGCRVYLADGKEIGMIEKVEILSSNENLAIRLKGERIGKESKKNELVYIPMVDEFVERVDIEGKTVVLKRMPEYL